ncbi:hypothetical protein GM182_01290 [bacterium 3DAC]|nr:hypothetical protein GM182_01290 [bacterium 3DAC]
MKIAITGSPRSGKTTLVKGILKHIDAVGFYTEEIRRAGRRYGFDIVTTWGERLPLARVGSHSPFKVGKYVVFPENLKPVIEKLLNVSPNTTVVIDEIGKMELLNIEFAKVVEKLWQEHKDIIVTIPIKDVHPLIKDIRHSADKLFNLDRENISSKKVLETKNKEG